MTHSTAITAAADDLGRNLPPAAGLRSDRKVGLFYFLWCGEPGCDGRPLDITKLLASDPQAGYRPDSDVWGGYAVYHHWGEPLYGYYHSRDAWVMRRHVEMLTRAGIDFLIFDTTNAAIYEENAKLLIRLLHEARLAGFDAPQIVFYTNTASGKTIEHIYDAIYRANFCPDTWFYLDGKPMIIGLPDECTPEMRAFFTVRTSQWPYEAAKCNGWPWMDFERPQRVFFNERGEPEVINVSVAQHPQIRFGDSALYGETTNRGRSFHDGANDPAEDAFRYGYNFAEQWQRALDTDPPYVFVTGWNEWIAGRWEGTDERPLGFVDCCDLTYSRDIEPMRGGYFDNYYMQMMQNIRRYKGCCAKPVALPGETIVYDAFPGMTAPRDCDGYQTHYADDSGRNEIRRVTVCDNGDTITFTAACAAPIAACDYHSTWMRLFLAVDNDENVPQCCGAAYLVNGYPFSDQLTSFAVCREPSRTIEADTFRICAQVPYQLDANRLTVTVPKALLGISQGDYRLRFKWADARTEITRWEEFYTQGCCAPIGRLFFPFACRAC